MTRKILVTGGAGYVGSHVCKALAAAGHEPVVFDDLSHGHPWAVQWGPLVIGDLSDGFVLAEALRGCAAVIHLAAYAYVGESVLEPRKYFANNVGNTLNLLDCMLDAGVMNVVFSSSCATYGCPVRLPIAEDDAQRPVSPYGETKLMVERVLHWYSAAYGLRHVTLRYFNAAGADEDGEIGEAHEPETHLVPLAIEAAQGRLPLLEVFGTDYGTPDGSAIRDYVHVSDLAEAHVRAVERLLDGRPGGSFNLGSGSGRSVLQVLAAVEQIGGSKVPWTARPRRPGDPAALLASRRQAEAELRWEASRSRLPNIVETAWRWHEAGRRPSHVRPAAEAEVTVFTIDLPDRAKTAEDVTPGFDETLKSLQTASPACRNGHDKRHP